MTVIGNIGTYATDDISADISTQKPEMKFPYRVSYDSDKEISVPMAVRAARRNRHYGFSSVSYGARNRTVMHNASDNTVWIRYGSGP